MELRITFTNSIAEFSGAEMKSVNTADKFKI